MAKFGEGDKPWIVEDRRDGTNVHNWHWSETDCLEWSKSFLSTLLSNQTILNGQNNLFISLKTLSKCEGEAYVNIRNGKIIPGYELSLQISFQGEARDAEGNTIQKLDGFVELPYISDENADEDPELRVVVKDEGEVGRRLKEGFLANGKGFVLDKVRAYVAAMASGGPAVNGKEELEVKTVGKKSVGGDPGAVERKEGKREEKKKKEGFKTISMTERFSCRAGDMYEILMDENRWKGFTQSNARISKEVGGEFSIFDGSVTGTNVELQPGKLIVQKWRFGSWNDGVHSMV